MVEISEVKLIACPDCKREVLDNVNYCRFCGHDFNEKNNESSGRFSKFLKNALKGSVIDSLRYCSHCKEELRTSDDEFCPSCGAVISFNDTFGFCQCGNMTSDQYCRLCNSYGYQLKKTISVVEYAQIWYNKVIIPLSKKYNQNFEETDLKEYFNLSSSQESHIVYRIMYVILFDEIKTDIVDFFEDIVNETKNYNNLEEAILNNIKKDIISSFYEDGVRYNRTSSLKSAHYEDVEMPVIKDKHGTGTKVLATAIAGPLGFVATSGIKQTTETKQVHVKGEYMHYEYLFNPKHISVKAYSNNSYDNSFHSENTTDKIVVRWNDIDYLDEDYYLILKTGEAVQLRMPVIEELVVKNILRVGGTINGHSNENFKLKYYDRINKKTPDILIELLNQFIDKHQDTSETNVDSNNSLVNELEKITNMYEKGLLTDREFIAMKQNIIGNKNSDVKTETNKSVKFCSNCGSEIIDDSKFCINCGTQLK